MGLHLSDIMASCLGISDMQAGNQQRLITVMHHDTHTVNCRLILTNYLENPQHIAGIK